MLNRLRFIFYYWLGSPRWDTGISPPELVNFIQTHPPGRALDLGCGTGTNLITLSQNGWQGVGIDFAPQAIQQARNKAKRAALSIDFRVGDVTRLSNITGEYNLILDIGCYHNLSRQDRQSYITQVQRLLAPDGTFLLYAFFARDPAAPRGVTVPEIDSIAQILKLISRVDNIDTSRPGSVQPPPSTWLAFNKPA